MRSDFGEISHDPNFPIFFREKADSARRPGLAENDEKDPEEEHEKVLRCWKCDTEITKDKQRISRDGKHLHTFFNPAGIVYDILQPEYYTSKIELGNIRFDNTVLRAISAGGDAFFLWNARQ